MSSKAGLSILEALENLNVIVDATSIDDLEISEENNLITFRDQKETEDEYWIKSSSNEETLEVVKETFRVVHRYLQNFYKKIDTGGEGQRVLEGINTIMVLVGEAAKKVEKLGLLFKERVSDIKEYKELQNFYQNKVIKESFKKFSKVPKPTAPTKKPLTEEETWDEEMYALFDQEYVEEVGGVHLLDDLEVVKKDHLYELFFLKNEAGHPFYTVELSKNIKLACDFGEFTEKYFGDDPLLQIKNWEDKSLHLLAKKILTTCKVGIDKFYEEAKNYRDMELVNLLHKCLMALILASNPKNLIRQFSLKGCYLYFADFQMFLREILHHRDYIKFLTYSVPASKPFFTNLLGLIESLCAAQFLIGVDYQELQNALVGLIDHHESKKQGILSTFLLGAYETLQGALKKHPNGPLFKAVDLVRREDTEGSIFDPLIQGNIPHVDGYLQRGDQKISLIRLPSPTTQEYIHLAQVNEEFKTFLRERSQKPEKFFHVVVNYQDRTSWKEHARCVALEELSRQAEFAKVFTVVTLPKDTEFYNQTGIYHDLKEAEEFIHQFHDHMQEESSGYYFPLFLKKELFPEWTFSLLTKIHESFFDSKKELSLRERLDFIELAYHFVELKLVEKLAPTSFSLISKDGLDVGATSQVGLLIFLGLGGHKNWTEDDCDEIATLLFGSTFLYRERVLHAECFDRLHHMVRLLENKKGFLRQFKSQFNNEVLQLDVKFNKK